jgi:DNA-directed RNA polymerase specialized sigma24 family protein
MHRSNHSTARCISSNRSPRPKVRLLQVLICAHRDLLVQTARHHLSNLRRDADDVVQDVCEAALQGELSLSSDPSEALDDLIQAVVSASHCIAEGGAA